LSGSGDGLFTSQACVVFSGTAVLKGAVGSIRLAARNGKACAKTADANTVSFSGRATVTGGTRMFTGARGTVSFAGAYARQTGVVTISLRGRIVY
jgi:hypothetical protein